MAPSSSLEHKASSASERASSTSDSASDSASDSPYTSPTVSDKLSTAAFTILATSLITSSTLPSLICLIASSLISLTLASVWKINYCLKTDFSTLFMARSMGFNSAISSLLDSSSEPEEDSLSLSACAASMALCN